MITEQTRPPGEPNRQALYDPHIYWERLLSGSFDTSGVAYSYLAVSFNDAMYRAERDVVRRVLAKRPAPRPICSALDVGCGTGIWLDFWRNFGVPSLTGVDLTEASISRLRGVNSKDALIQPDLGDQGLQLDRQFDVISAMSVLLHIVDPDRFSAALANLARHLSPDGRLLMVEPVIVNGWWGGDLEPFAHSCVRTIEEWKRELATHNLEIVDLRPVTFLLANPIDAKRRRAMRVWLLYWSYILRFVGRRERLGSLLGRALEVVDRPLRRAIRPGPSAKLLVVRHRGAAMTSSFSNARPELVP